MGSSPETTSCKSSLCELPSWRGRAKQQQHPGAARAVLVFARAFAPESDARRGETRSARPQTGVDRGLADAFARLGIHSQNTQTHIFSFQIASHEPVAPARRRRFARRLLARDTQPQTPSRQNARPPGVRFFSPRARRPWAALAPSAAHVTTGGWPAEWAVCGWLPSDQAGSLPSSAASAVAGVAVPPAGSCRRPSEGAPPSLAAPPLPHARTDPRPSPHVRCPAHTRHHTTPPRPHPPAAAARARARRPVFGRMRRARVRSGRTRKISCQFECGGVEAGVEASGRRGG